MERAFAVLFWCIACPAVGYGLWKYCEENNETFQQIVNEPQFKEKLRRQEDLITRLKREIAEGNKKD